MMGMEWDGGRGSCGEYGQSDVSCWMPNTVSGHLHEPNRAIPLHLEAASGEDVTVGCRNR